MKTRSFLFAALILLQIPVIAQWIQQNSNTSNDLYDIHFINDSTGFAVGYNGTFLKTNDRGENWHLSIIDTSEYIISVYAINEDTIFASGFDHIYKTIDGGQNWSIINSQLSANELKFFSSQVGFAKALWLEQCPYPNAGDAPRYKYYRTLDGGTSWEAYDFLKTHYTYYAEMEIVTPDTGYLGAMEIGFWCGYWPCCEEGRSSFFRTTDGGLTWQEISAGDNGILNDVTFFNGSDGFAVYEYFSPYGYGQLAELNKITESGEQIQLGHSLPEYNVDKFFFANTIQGYYLLNHKIMKTTTEGYFWSLDYQADHPLRDVALTENLEAYVVGYGGIILHQKINPVTEPEPLFWLSCNEDKLIFPMTNINGESILEFNLVATGNMDVTVDISAPYHFPVKTEASGEFVQEITGLVIPAGHDTTIFVAFHPYFYGNLSQSLEITSNATNYPTITMPLHGKGVCFLPDFVNNDTSFCYDTVWVRGHVSVNAGRSLSFCPGTVVNFQGGYHFNIDGTLTAIGTVYDSIRFTGENRWAGIFVIGDDPADSVVLKYCRIANTNRDIWPDTDNGGGLNITGNKKVEVSHSTFIECDADDNGGGIYCAGSGFSITDCRFYSCGNGLSGGAVYYAGSRKKCITNCIIDHCGADYGGGIYLDAGEDSVVMNCTITNCMADYGAGMYLSGSHYSLIDCIIKDCSGDTGGGIYTASSGPSEISGCTIENCNAGVAGGIFATGGSRLQVQNSMILSCEAETAGGGLYLNIGSDVLVRNCEIAGNHVINGNGGGIFIDRASPEIISNSINWNMTFYGGGSGIYCISGSPKISSNMFFENWADGSGGGICLDNMEADAIPAIIQNVFYNNLAGNNKGGAIYLNNNKADIILNTISGNYRGGIYCSQPILHRLLGNIIYGNESYELMTDNINNTTLSYCDIKGGWTGGGAGNINLDPMFYGLPYYPWYLINVDYSLMPESPCIDAGPVDNTGFGLPDTDLAGNPRFIGGRLDMGAYENNFLYQSIDTGFCETLDFQIEALPVQENIYDNCEWTFNDEKIPGTDSHQYLLTNPQPENEGYYQCLFFNNEGQFLRSRKIYLYDKGSPPIPQIQPVGAVLSEGEEYEMIFYFYSPDNATKCQWFLNDAPIEGETEQIIFIHDFKKEQQGSYKCRAENTCGTIFSDDAVLQLTPSGFAENETSVFSVFPNPAGSQLTITPSPAWGRAGVGADQSAVRLEINNLLGTKITGLENISSFPVILDISSLAPGMYILRLNSAEGFSGSVKFMKVAE